MLSKSEEDQTVHINGADFEKWLAENNQKLTEEEEIQKEMDAYLDQMQEADDFFSRCVVEGCSGKMVSQDPAPYSLCDVCGALATDPPK